ncbi:hypothetical protein EDD86DRAFT_247612 [Gorgonomyces haynaldii]|nr:hypothetical protein EDD86DRAFT_247612 [Gorgonomyces haynaldii]
MHLEVDELKWSALDLRDYTIRDYLHQHKSEPLSTRPLEPLELSEDTMQYLLSVFCDQFSEESFQPYLPIVRILLDPVHGPMLSRDAIITCAATHAQRLGKSEQDRIGKISLQRYYHSLFSSTETQSLIDIVYNFPGSTFFWSRMLIVNSQHLREPANSPLLDCLRINTMWLLKIANVFYSSFLLKQPDLAYCYPEMPFPASIENDMKPDWTHAVAIQPWNPYVVTGSLDLNGTYCTLHLIQVKILETRIKGVDYYEIESICCALQDWYDYFSTLSYQDTLKSNIWYSLAETEYYWLHLLLFLPHLKRYLTRPSKTASLNVNRCLRAIRMISIIFRSFAEEISFDMLPPHTTQVLAHCCIGQCLVIKYLNIETITETKDAVKQSQSWARSQDNDTSRAGP